MEVIRFLISGQTAHFKKPDVNSYCYYTYNHLPKPQLLGILGAVLGLGGYTQQGESQYPEFYEKLQFLKVAVLPIGNKRGLFSKKVQTFNNSVGYASGETGNNLIVREQWLEDVKWEILIDFTSLEDKDLQGHLKNILLNGEAVYMPYLGKNDHMADITEPFLVEIHEVDGAETLESLFKVDDFIFEDDFDDEDEPPFMFKDYMPVGFTPENMYEFKKIGFTNRRISTSNAKVYAYNQQNIVFI
ncbi:type I-B CRISPR-associated protein Cas5b [Fusibacter sp. 3D3]|uniref:type I-B CRISPR-associated protein Cas5b n=1 Tax=Fusibacter sp. 3D3 TaxID=1048380 RepID=UPI000852C65E|nr:type I-B CRISPR-associated protein Cas5b [Fusibacter sp. 3D3]GAU77701.1 CRISPR-associated protein, Cas5h family [Fusibacter sp. 3D3]